MRQAPLETNLRPSAPGAKHIRQLSGLGRSAGPEYSVQGQ